MHVDFKIFLYTFCNLIFCEKTFFSHAKWQQWWRQVLDVLMPPWSFNHSKSSKIWHVVFLTWLLKNKARQNNVVQHMSTILVHFKQVAKESCKNHQGTKRIGEISQGKILSFFTPTHCNYYSIWLHFNHIWPF
jgi:hypothetical protein